MCLQEFNLKFVPFLNPLVSRCIGIVQMSNSEQSIEISAKNRISCSPRTSPGLAYP